MEPGTSTFNRRQNLDSSENAIFIQFNILPCWAGVLFLLIHKKSVCLKWDPKAFLLIKLMLEAGTEKSTSHIVVLNMRMIFKKNAEKNCIVCSM